MGGGGGGPLKVPPPQSYEAQNSQVQIGLKLKGK